MFSRPGWFVGGALLRPLKLNFKLFTLFANCTCFVVFLSVQANASEDNSDLSKVRVTYAGFAMVGRAVDVEKSYPYSAKIEKEIQKAVYEIVNGVKPKHYVLITDDLGDADKGDSVSLALVLDHEKISVEKVAEFHKLLIEVSAQAIVYDFANDEGAIIASYPVALPPFIELFDAPPTEKEIAQLVHDYYFGGLTEFNAETDEGKAFGSIVDRFRDVVRDSPIKLKYASEIGIGDITIQDSVKEFLPEKDKHDDTSLRFALARYLASQLAVHQQVSVIPRVIDSSIGQMALRFSGERSHQFLKLPKPDYLLDFDVRAIQESVIKETNIGQVKGYRTIARFNLRYQDGLDDTPIFSRAIRSDRFKSIPKTMQVDEWAPREASLLGLIEEFSENISSPSKSWKKHQELKKSDLKQFEKFKEVLALCR